MKLVLDTSLLIAYLRNFPKAIVWMEAHRADRAVIPSLALMEIYQGCQDRKELLAVQKALGTFATAHLTKEDSVLALQLHKEHCLSSGLSIPDAMIAAITVNRKATLMTFNGKDFGVVAGLSVQVPYE